jgi:hypothetical protein
MISSATLSKFFYRLNVGNLAGDIIPLGVVALLRDDEKAFSYLVLIARASLTDAERSKMDWAAHKMLVNPLEFLSREVDAVLGERVGDDLFERLSQKLSWSIYVSPPSTTQVPKDIAADMSKAVEALSRAAGPQGEAKFVAKGMVSIVRPRLPNALARIAGPEFAEGAMGAYMPQAWVLAGSHVPQRYAD